MRFSLERSCSGDISGRTRWSSTKRRGPAARSRTISSVHLSPTRSSARESGDHWSYGWRLGGGTWGMGFLRLDGFPSYLPSLSLTDAIRGASQLRKVLENVFASSSSCRRYGQVWDSSSSSPNVRQTV